METHKEFILAGTQYVKGRWYNKKLARLREVKVWRFLQPCYCLKAASLVQGDHFRAIAVVSASNGGSSDWKTVVRINNNGRIYGLSRKSGHDLVIG